MKIVEFKDYDNQTTPLSAYNLNRLQQNLITTKYQMTFSSAVSGGSTITLPCYYQVGQDTLDVYLNSELLKKASTKDSEGHYYEVGNSDTKSNQIKITSDWSIASGDVLNLIVRGTTDSYDQNLSPDKATQLADEISANKEEITALQTENSRLKGITNALPKISGEDTSLTLTNTANAPFSKLILKGNTSQNGEPTPSSPVDVNVVSGSNVVKISSKNLLDGATWTKNQALDESNTAFTATGWEYSNYIDISQANYYYSGISGGIPKTILYDKNKNVIAVLKVSYNTVYNLSSYKAKYIRVSTTTSGKEKTKVYQGKEFPLDLGNIELCKIGEYKDYIFKENNKWYKHKVIDKIVLNGDMNWIFFDKGKEIGIKSNSVIQISNALIPVTDSTQNETPLFSSHFVKGTQTIVIKGYNFIGFSKWGNDIYLYLPNDYDSIDTAKKWLNTNKPIVYYAISTPTEEEITDTTLINQLNEISQAVSYDDTTNIFQTNANLPFIINAEAFKKIS